jgi:ubiquitin carboxyl-terminal hydrolase 36/42
MYRLYGIICHAGGSPNSGHYYAYVRTSEGVWARMNDEDNQALSAAPPYDHKNAYMLFYMREPSMTATIAAATTSHNKPPVALLSGLKRKREDGIFDSRSQEDLGEVLATQRTTSPFRDLPPSLSGNDDNGPSPAKRPRYETSSGAVPVENLAKNPTVKSRFKFTDPHRSIPTAEPKPKPKPFKDLGLSYLSSEAEDPEESPLPAPSSQTDVASETHPSSLPVSREGTPEYPTQHIQRAWQRADTGTSSARTSSQSPPSSSDSRKRKNREADENAVASGSKLKRQKSEEDIPAWLSARDGDGGLHNMSKKYKSNAKKERRERRGHQNPYGLMGIPASDRVQFGAKKNKRPPAL